MLRAKAMAVTTRHSPSAYPWQCQPGLPAVGPLIGLDELGGGGVFCFDPFELYRLRLLGSPNMAVLGQLGKGKSAMVKAYLARQACFGRRLYAMDPKGEYRGLADRVGLATLSPRPGGPHRLNPLDPGPGGAEEQGDLDRRRRELVGALAAAGLDRALEAEERAAVGAAVASLGAKPVLADVVTRMLEPSDSMAEALSTTTARLKDGARPAALELLRLLEGDLAGMFDGPTTVRLDADGPGLVVDLSACWQSAALAPAMICAGSWLSEAIAARAGPPRLLVLDEAWAALRLVSTTRWLQGVSKLARAYGVSLITVIHRPSDLSSQADEGSESSRQAQGLLSDAETRVIFAQSPAEADLAQRLFGLSATEAQLISRLAPHRALWRVGPHAAVVEVVLTEADLAMCDTDQRMEGR
jgi:type IV secretory pathway VirB4 component